MNNARHYILIAYVDGEFVTHHHDNKNLAEGHFYEYCYYSEYDAALLDEYMNVIAQT